VDAKRNAWQPGAYVAAHGDVTKDKSTGNKRINAFNIRVVTDHNEVSCAPVTAPRGDSGCQQ
jgi:hypothetical protein